ncbi:polyprenyl synthetase family protein [Bhargavaea ullalensis]|uniref:Geranylgeranyl diphosphate synthase type II n=1 Tax=Bhargavaea ullalensis TaxID=1265685 RepID=A0ABV2G979_9BACL
MNELLRRFMESRADDLVPVLEESVRRLSAPSVLKESMLYSLMAGGKRIRPLLVSAVLHDLGKVHPAELHVGAAVELIHTYSLVHDDLPSMDDDDLRRGKPTNHKVFGEAAAILAGDALLTESFGLIGRAPALSSDDKVELIVDLVRASGAEGMVGGQVLDIQSEDKTLSEEGLEQVHRLKTGALLGFSVGAGAILAGATAQQREDLKRYARHIGLAFQIQDDILDVEGDEALTGKKLGTDAAHGKNTYPSLLTLEGAKQKLIHHHSEAVKAISFLKEPEPMLRLLADYIVKRSS